MKAQTCLGAREREKESEDRENERENGAQRLLSIQQTVHRSSKLKGNSRKALTRGLTRSRHRIQRRGDARVQGMSVRKRRAIAADHSANDTAKRATISGMLLLSRVCGRDENRTRDGEVACERETNLRLQQNALF